MSQSKDSGERIKCKVVVSDFHLGSGEYFQDGTRNILEDFHWDDAFISFIKYYSTGKYGPNSEVELIINGDFINLLQINYKGVHTHLLTERIIVEGLKKCVRGHKEIFQALKKFASIANHSVTYVIGNHDQGMCFPKAQEYFQEVLNHDVKFFYDAYVFDGVRVEHGHVHEWPTRYDHKRYKINRGLPEPILNLPWGSIFVAVCLPKIKMDRPYVDKVKPFSAMLRWMIFNDLFYGLKALWYVLGFIMNTLIFRRIYKYSDLKTKYNIIKEITIYPDFDRDAKRVLLNDPNIHTMIMGHTHIVRYKRYREGKEYYNIGTWNEATSLDVGNFGTLVNLTFAYIEYPELPPDIDIETTHDKTLTKPKVRLKEWRGHWQPEVDAAV